MAGAPAIRFLPFFVIANYQASERPGAVAADIDTIRSERAVRLLDRGLHGKLHTRLDVGLAADFIAHDMRIGGNDDALVAFLVLDDEARLAAARRRQNRAGRLDSPIGHGAILRAVPARTMAVALAALRFREDVHFDCLLAAVG